MIGAITAGLFGQLGGSAPDVPTIGTATGGNAQATVTFTPAGTGAAGGGNGGVTTDGTAASANSGSGGGGGGYSGGAKNGGNGGSGIVILRYPDTNLDLASIGGGLTYTKTTTGGYKIYQFTSGTGTVTI